jgi:hypothetical protein
MSNEDKIKEKYTFKSVSLHRIRNKYEQKVIENMDAVLREFPDYQPNTLDIQDIYALALNKLPPYYKQETSIVLSGSLDKQKAQQAIREAVERVRENPNYEENA